MQVVFTDDNNQSLILEEEDSTLFSEFSPIIYMIAEFRGNKIPIPLIKVKDFVSSITMLKSMLEGTIINTASREEVKIINTIIVPPNCKLWWMCYESTQDVEMAIEILSWLPLQIVSVDDDCGRKACSVSYSEHGAGIDDGICLDLENVRRTYQRKDYDMVSCKQFGFKSDCQRHKYVEQGFHPTKFRHKRCITDISISKIKSFVSEELINPYSNNCLLAFTASFSSERKEVYSTHGICKCYTSDEVDHKDTVSFFDDHLTRLSEGKEFLCVPVFALLDVDLKENVNFRFDNSETKEEFSNHYISSLRHVKEYVEGIGSHYYLHLGFYID